MEYTAKTLISVIIPCYNQADFLPEALESVLAQNYTNWECVLVDDGSKDKTAEVAKAWQIKDTRFQYYYKENGGLSSARNYGLEKSKGTYIQFLDADDTIAPEKMDASVKAMQSDTGNTVVISNYKTIIQSTGKLIAPYYNLQASFFTFEKVLFEWDETFAIPIHCGFFKAQLFKDFKFSEFLRAKEDWVMWVYLFKYDAKAVFIDKYLAFYRKHEESMTHATAIFPETVKAINHIKSLISYEQVVVLEDVLLNRYHKKITILREELVRIKSSFSYRLAKKIEAFLKRMKITR